MQFAVIINNYHHSIGSQLDLPILVDIGLSSVLKESVFISVATPNRVTRHIIGMQQKRRDCFILPDSFLITSPYAAYFGDTGASGNGVGLNPSLEA